MDQEKIEKTEKTENDSEKVTLILSKEEAAAIEELRKKEEEDKKKPFNIYKYVKIPVKVLDGVIFGGIALIIILIIVGALT